ncbi:MAG: flagellar hook basal-body protein [Sedimentisphaerales bacterium]|nr:flagellar hook basal-body protein [Sedimentisphaerales bacterium]
MSTDINTQVSSNVAALEQEFNAIAHNLANASTTGYKRITTSFSKAMDAQRGSTSGVDTQQAEATLALDLSQGNTFIETGGKLDLALYGKGFFVIETEDGPLYTRKGRFQVNENGQVVDSQGRIVSGNGGPVTIPGSVSLSQVVVSNDGTVSADGQSLGKFEIVDFPENTEDIIPVGNSCYKVPENVDSSAVDNVTMRQGYLESSNVKIVDELVNMIMVTRLYEANMKFITTKQEASSNLMSVAMG